MKETDLPDLLEHLGYQVKRVGSYYTTKEMDSLRIKNRRTWFRYSEGTGGDAITFLQHFCGKSFQEAVRYLLAFQGRARDPPQLSTPKTVPLKEKTPFVLPPPSTDHRRVFAYLRKRGIAGQVIRAFLRSGLLYEDAEYHNCVFVGRNREGIPAFANKRGTCDLDGHDFKGDAAGSDKSIAFRLPCDPSIRWVLVFESPIDLMSFCTLNRTVASNAVALCGLYQGALDRYLLDYPHLEHIVLCLDTDKPGQEAMEHLRENYRQRGYKVSARMPAQGKDWNDYLQHHRLKKVKQMEAVL